MTEVTNQEEYVEAMKAQILEILNKVKQEVGVDIPVEIIVKDDEDD